MGVRDALRKAAGLIVELPEDEQEADESWKSAEPASTRMPDEPAPQSGNRASTSADQPARTHAASNLDEITAFGPGPLNVPPSDEKMGFSFIYEKAGLPATPFTAEQMLEILSSQPKELPIETRRQMVRATLHALEKSVGVTPDTVVADASKKLAILAEYVDSLSRQTSEFVSNTEKEIATLEEQVAKKRKDIAFAQQKQEQQVRLCRAESDRLSEVVGFFGKDTPTTPQGNG